MICWKSNENAFRMDMEKQKSIAKSFEAEMLADLSAVIDMRDPADILQVGLIYEQAYYENMSHFLNLI